MQQLPKVGGSKGDRFTYDGFHRLAHSFLGVDTATRDLSDAELVVARHTV